MTDSWEEHLSRIRSHDLADLRWHWDGAYRIWWDEKFRAARLDDGAALTAETADDLRELIRGNYRRRHVQRLT
jgi:hypothetical protein